VYEWVEPESLFIREQSKPVDAAFFDLMFKTAIRSV
jgi:hypothetical protein